MTAPVFHEFKAMFEALPILCGVLSPDFKIIAATDAWVAAGQQQRDRIMGRVIYEAFPDNPLNNGSLGAKTLISSLKNVISTKQPDDMGVIRYDVEQPGGGFVERWWRPNNVPVLDARRNVQYIFHLVDDINNLLSVMNQAEQAAKARGMTSSLIGQFFS